MRLQVKHIQTGIFIFQHVEQVRRAAVPSTRKAAASRGLLPTSPPSSAEFKNACSIILLHYMLPSWRAAELGTGIIRVRLKPDGTR